jgi:ribosome-associated protein
MDFFLLRRSIHNFAAVTFSRSGGPGGQNVNKLNTKVTLSLKLRDLEGLSEAEQTRLRDTLSSRLSHREESGEEELVISASEERSQRTNIERAYGRAEALIVNGARLPKLRRPTKPSKAARERRLQAKHIHSAKKAGRRIKD